ncbi:MAG TPA: hypothetical protein VF765_37730 [Polyangiaceae bacterium]
MPAPAIDVDLRGYYHGEQISAYVLGGMGAAAAGVGAYLATRDEDFSRGLGWAWIGFGGLEAIAGAVYALQVDAEIRHYESVLARDPSAFRAEEIDHITGTTRRFVIYRTTEIGLTLAGVGMAAYGIAAKRDAWTGAGVGVGSLALPLFLFDTVNNARAASYLERVEAFDPRVGIGPSPTTGQGLLITLGAKF